MSGRRTTVMLHNHPKGSVDFPFPHVFGIFFVYCASLSSRWRLHGHEDTGTANDKGTVDANDAAAADDDDAADISPVVISPVDVSCSVVQAPEASANVR